MGYMRHHSIIVTTSHADIDTARDQAVEIFGEKRVSLVLYSPSNSYKSFFISPDGSKEGWAESDAGDEQREAFIKWLDSKRYNDGSSALTYAEVQFGDEQGDDKILRSSEWPVKNALERMAEEVPD